MAMAHPVRDDIDLLDGGWWAAQPYEQWAWMREHAPVYYDEANKTWAITKHADILAIERNPGDFSSRRSPRPHGDPLPMMISMDDPDHHRRRRKLVQQAASPRAGSRDHELDHAARLCTRDRRSSVCERGECDFVWDIAAPLPLLLIADHARASRTSTPTTTCSRWSDDMIRGTTGTPTPEVQMKAMHAGMAFREYQLGVIADRKKNPGHDLISTLVHAEIDGARLDDESLVQETLLILIGGDETTRHVITHGTLALMDFPDQAEILRNGSEAEMIVGVEELLRWVSPIKNMSRTVQRDLEFRGQQMQAEDQVIVVYPSANRDAEVFADPDQLNVRRDPNPHLAFGFGPHFCLGASLARLELKVMFTEILRRLPDLRLANDDPLPWRPSNFIVGPEAMPVRFTPTPSTR